MSSLERRICIISSFSTFFFQSFQSMIWDMENFINTGEWRHKINNKQRELKSEHKTSTGSWLPWVTSESMVLGREPKGTVLFLSRSAFQVRKQITNTEALRQNIQFLNSQFNWTFSWSPRDQTWYLVLSPPEDPEEVKNLGVALLNSVHVTLWITISYKWPYSIIFAFLGYKWKLPYLAFLNHPFLTFYFKKYQKHLGKHKFVYSALWILLPTSSIEQTMNNCSMYQNQEILPFVELNELMEISHAWYFFRLIIFYSPIAY